jgi:hypothetical protein
MHIFLSYASEDVGSADEVRLALTGSGYQVFFDRESLLPADDYHARIRDAVERSDTFVFLISPSSLTQGNYALTELKYARRKWPHPKGRVVPVIIEQVSWDAIPVYLKAVTVLEPEGNIPAEVLAAIVELEPVGSSEPAGAGAWVDSKRQALKKQLSELRENLEKLDVQAVVRGANDPDAEGAAKEFSGKLFEALDTLRNIEPGLYPDQFYELEHQLNRAWLRLEYAKDPAGAVRVQDFAFADELLEFAHRLSAKVKSMGPHEPSTKYRATRKPTAKGSRK